MNQLSQSLTLLSSTYAGEGDQVPAPSWQGAPSFHVSGTKPHPAPRSKYRINNLLDDKTTKHKNLVQQTNRAQLH